MFNHIDLFTLLFAPVIAYLVAACVFAAVQSKYAGQQVSASTTPLQYTDGHSK